MAGEEELQAREVVLDAAMPGKRARALPLLRRVADSFFFLEGGPKAWDLPVAGARRYISHVRPVPLPSSWLKLVVMPVFWLICLLVHHGQMYLQDAWHVPGQRDETVKLVRTGSPTVQVCVNIAAVMVVSVYSLGSYLGHGWIMEKVLNPIFTPASWLGHVSVASVMYVIAAVSSFYLKENWVAAAAGLFAFFGYLVVGRMVQPTASQKGQIALGPSRAEEDVGRSFHQHGWSAESGAGGSGDEGAAQAILLEGEPGGSGNSGGDLCFALLCAEPFTMGDDAVVVERLPGGAYHYWGPCGRANIFRTDTLLVLLFTFGLRLPWFILGAGGLNQCVGWVELLVALAYIPVGYTCFAVLGFRVALTCRWDMMVVLVLCFWPAINLILGGKGCATLTYLISGHYLPEIWDPSAHVLEFRRGYAKCAESAFAFGGETLLVASTTAAAWVHIMSNFSLLVGFLSGMLRLRSAKATRQRISII